MTTILTEEMKQLLSYCEDEQQKNYISRLGEEIIEILYEYVLDKEDDGETINFYRLRNKILYDTIQRLDAEVDEKLCDIGVSTKYGMSIQDSESLFKLSLGQSEVVLQIFISVPHYLILELSGAIGYLMEYNIKNLIADRIVIRKFQEEDMTVITEYLLSDMLLSTEE